MWMCQECGRVFETPDTVPDVPLEHFGHPCREEFDECGGCGSTDIGEAVMCDECAQWVDRRYADEHAGQCPICVEKARQKFERFCALLTYREKQALNILSYEWDDDFFK